MQYAASVQWDMHHPRRPRLPQAYFPLAAAAGRLTAKRRGGAVLGGASRGRRRHFSCAPPYIPFAILRTEQTCVWGGVKVAPLPPARPGRAAEAGGRGPARGAPARALGARAGAAGVVSP
jgi:hypothetical protein